MQRAEGSNSCARARAASEVRGALNWEEEESEGGFSRGQEVEGVAFGIKGDDAVPFGTHLGYVVSLKGCER